MSTDAELFTIGQLAARTGLTSRTIRFWSDAGLVPPSGRSASGYRLYDAEAVARLDLVWTLRELGLGLEVVRAVLARATTLAQVAAAHVAVLDEQIRILRLRRRPPCPPSSGSSPRCAPFPGRTSCHADQQAAKAGNPRANPGQPGACRHMPAYRAL
jgi:DNA-binding transcriptional MerR regulator